MTPSHRASRRQGDSSTPPHQARRKPRWVSVLSDEARRDARIDREEFGLTLGQLKEVRHSRRAGAKYQAAGRAVTSPRRRHGKLADHVCPADPDRDAAHLHTVRPGETFDSIAERYGVIVGTSSAGTAISRLATGQRIASKCRAPAKKGKPRSKGEGRALPQGGTSGRSLTPKASRRWRLGLRPRTSGPRQRPALDHAARFHHLTRCAMARTTVDVVGSPGCSSARISAAARQAAPAPASGS